jgi:NAD(P)-dependent dehydrogenase (short-subunit alcohol dehydrogenase family)
MSVAVTRRKREIGIRLAIGASPRAVLPMKRPAQPEEIAPAYVFLAAPSDSSYITGEIINLFGGDPTP